MLFWSKEQDQKLFLKNFHFCRFARNFLFQGTKPQKRHIKKAFHTKNSPHPPTVRLSQGALTSKTCNNVKKWLNNTNHINISLIVCSYVCSSYYWNMLKNRFFQLYMDFWIQSWTKYCCHFTKIIVLPPPPPPPTYNVGIYSWFLLQNTTQSQSTHYNKSFNPNIVSGGGGVKQ